jgi:hypothetical protein
MLRKAFAWADRLSERPTASAVFGVPAPTRNGLRGTDGSAIGDREPCATVRGGAESGDLGHDTRPTFLGCAFAGHPELETESVLGGLRLENLQQAQTGRDAGRRRPRIIQLVRIEPTGRRLVVGAQIRSIKTLPTTPASTAACASAARSSEKRCSGSPASSPTDSAPSATAAHTAATAFALASGSTV